MKKWYNIILAVIILSLLLYNIIPYSFKTIEKTKLEKMALTGVSSNNYVLVEAEVKQKATKVEKLENNPVVFIEQFDKEAYLVGDKEKLAKLSVDDKISVFCYNKGPRQKMVALYALKIQIK
jgi:hypothetical protein